VLDDVREGSVSREAAESLYGVVLTSDGGRLAVDHTATAQRRAAIHKDRT
jgi:N-methylhydantoinase B/oxoprolinase/acetone carboxylase alpha subunit